MNEGETQLLVRIQPRAKRNEIREKLTDGRYKIGITAPPANGKANLALVNFLAKFLRLAKSNIRIVSGISSRNKSLSIKGMASNELHSKLMESII
jgi:hypothetical protein